MGKPVIATNVPGCREVVEPSLNGFLCQPRNANDLAECMRKFFFMPREARLNMGIAARQKMETEFDERIVINSYLEKLSILKA